MLALIYEDAFLNYLFNESNVAIAIYRADDNRLTAVNPTFAKLFGYSSHKALCQPLEKFLSTECISKLSEIESLPKYKNDEKVTFEVNHTKEDGSIVTLSITFSLVKSLYNSESKHRIIKVIELAKCANPKCTLGNFNAKLQAIISTIPDMLWMKDPNGVYLVSNSPFQKTLNKTKDEIIGSTDYELFSKEEADNFKLSDLETIKTNQIRFYHKTIISQKSNEKIALEVRKSPVYDSNNQLLGILGIGRDVTKQKQYEEQLLMIDTAINRISEAIYITDINSSILYVNEGACNMLGYTKDELTSMNICDIDINTSKENLKELSHLSFTTKHKTKSGELIEVEITGSHFRFHDKLSHIAVVKDVTQQKNIERRLEFVAMHDMLTALPNRLLLEERLNQTIRKIKNTTNKVALLFIDLDGFKTINDSLGHTIGDMVLKTVAQKLQNCIKPTDTLSRHGGGDEFVILVSEVHHKQELIELVEKILQEFKKSFQVDDQILSITCSIGIAVYPNHGENFDQLLQSSDTAMYKAKANGKNTYCFFTQQMKHHMIGFFKMQNDLKEAIQKKEFILHYQPQIDLSQNKIIGAEALIRWEHPYMGMIPPKDFISVAETCGYIVEIGEWIIHEACHQAAIWNNNGKDIVVAINISAVQFQRGNLVDVLKSALAITKLNPKYLELELTESILINDTENVLQTVKVIKELGIQLSIDDFGTGYSSLAYLKRFAVDKLKIDQSFIRDIVQDKEDASIVKTIIQIAKSFNLKSIAEGVENEEVLNVVKKFGCDEVQGYHFAKPMVATEFQNYYKNTQIASQTHQAAMSVDETSKLIVSDTASKQFNDNKNFLSSQKGASKKLKL